MAHLSDGERKVRLLALIPEIEKLRREAKALGSDMRAFMLALSEEEANNDLERLGVVSRRSGM